MRCAKCGSVIYFEDEHAYQDGKGEVYCSDCILHHVLHELSIDELADELGFDIIRQDEDYEAEKADFDCKNRREEALLEF